MTAKASIFALLFALAVPAVVVACTASASFQAGGSDAPPPPPPPPPPPVGEATATPSATATTTAAPTATATTTATTTAAPTTTTPKPSVSGSSVTLPGTIEFESGKATFKAGTNSEQSLAQLKQFLDENARITKLRIEGHTDNVGGADANLKLSGERALAIKRWLVEHGVVKERLIAAGFGQTKPVADNATEEGRAKNRRTEFRIAELSGKPYLGNDPTGGGKVFDL
ncbi:MAG TPA: OmpA family protein [Polyangiaceae bacterium]|nr:OmpA family protein [Polyangiaceae bacterium]